MNRIKARLSNTSESWIASIVLVLNLIKLIGRASLSLLIKLYEKYKAFENPFYIILKNHSSENNHFLKPGLISRPYLNLVPYK